MPVPSISSCAKAEAAASRLELQPLQCSFSSNLLPVFLSVLGLISRWGARELYKGFSDAASDKKRQFLQMETCRAFTPVREGVFRLSSLSAAGHVLDTLATVKRETNG